MKSLRSYQLPPSPYLLGGLIALPVILILLVTWITQAAPRPTPSGPPSDWTLSKLDGTSAKLSDFSGQVRLLNFWAAWCGTCREEMPDLVTLKEDFKGRPFSVLGINFGEDYNTAHEFATRYGADFPLFLDPDRRVATSYGVITIPTSILLDKNGHLIKTWVGQIDPATVRNEVNRLIN